MLVKWKMKLEVGRYWIIFIYNIKNIMVAMRQWKIREICIHYLKQLLLPLTILCLLYFETLFNTHTQSPLTFEILWNRNREGFLKRPLTFLLRIIYKYEFVQTLSTGFILTNQIYLFKCSITKIFSFICN